MKKSVGIILFSALVSCACHNNAPQINRVVHAGWAKEIKDTATYVHTINDPKLAKHYVQDLGLTSVYTDFLPIEPEND